MLCQSIVGRMILVKLVFVLNNFKILAPEETSDETSVSAGDPILGAPGETPSNPTGPRYSSAMIPTHREFVSNKPLLYRVR